MRTLACTALPFVLAACAAPPFDAKAVALEWASYMQRDYSLRPGDKLTVRVELGAADDREQAAVRSAPCARSSTRSTGSSSRTRA
jgi:hypothetical protein